MKRVDKPAYVNLNPTGQGGLKDSPTEFKVLTSNRGCIKGSGEKKGCVRFTDNEYGKITFGLKGQGAPVVTCAGANDPTKVITKIELSAIGDTSGPQPSSKGNFKSSSYPMAKKYRDEGFPALDIDTGVVYEETVDNLRKDKVAITNINFSNVPHPKGLNIWYRVTVKECGKDEYWVTDPRVENDGMN